MRKLTAGTNIDLPSGDYPKGRVRDSNGGPGTIGNEVLFGDIIQFFQKLIIDNGTVENDLPESVTNGYQLIQALDARFYKKKELSSSWDLDLGPSTLDIPHGLDASKIRTITGYIIGNSLQYSLPAVLEGGDEINVVILSWNSTNVTLRKLPVVFDSELYDNSTIVLTVEYKD